MASIREYLTTLRKRLSDAGVSNPDVEARYLAMHATKLTAAEMLVRGSEELQGSVLQSIQALAQRRISGEPLAYLLGEAEFYGRTFAVRPGVLIPRSDTEILVDQVITHLASVSPSRVLDLGTGSACIAITLAIEISNAEVHAVEQSSVALQVARENADRLLVERSLTLHEGSWFDGLPSSLKHSFDAIISNPPYIPLSERPTLDISVRDHEPEAALFRKTGLESYQEILSHTREWLKPSGFVAFEVGFGQADAVAELMQQAGLTRADIREDYGGVPRVVIAHTE